MLISAREGDRERVKTTHVLAGNSVDNIIRRSAQELGDDGELVDVILSGEQRLALQHLGKDAPSAPDINLDVVFLPGEHDLGSSVISGGNVTRHLRVLDSGEAKVANLEIAVLVDEDVAGLEIAVDDAGRMHVLETSLRGRGWSAFSAMEPTCTGFGGHTMIW